METPSSLMTLACVKKTHRTHQYRWRHYSDAIKMKAMCEMRVPEFLLSSHPEK